MKNPEYNPLPICVNNLQSLSHLSYEYFSTVGMQINAYNVHPLEADKRATINEIIDRHFKPSDHKDMM